MSCRDALAAHARAVYASADLLHSRADVEAALDRMAGDITAALHESCPVVLCVMTGGLVPTQKLVERMDFLLELDYVHATRYSGSTRGSELRWIARPAASIDGRVVLVVDDILDEGFTLAAILEDCRARGAREVYSAVLAEKERPRSVSIRADFTGLQVENRYVFGYGMDYRGYFRNLKGIYAVRDDG
jgi:hypoxanthine phosphoribosyltransferase